MESRQAQDSREVLTIEWLVCQGVLVMTIHGNKTEKEILLERCNWKIELPRNIRFDHRSNFKIDTRFQECRHLISKVERFFLRNRYFSYRFDYFN